MSISLKRKKIFQKEKRHSFVFRKAFQIRRKKIPCHTRFNSDEIMLATTHRKGKSFLATRASNIPDYKYSVLVQRYTVQLRHDRLARLYLTDSNEL